MISVHWKKLLTTVYNNLLVHFQILCLYIHMNAAVLNSLLRKSRPATVQCFGFVCRVLVYYFVPKLYHRSMCCQRAECTTSVWTVWQYLPRAMETLPSISKTRDRHVFWTQFIIKAWLTYKSGSTLTKMKLSSVRWKYWFYPQRFQTITNGDSNFGLLTIKLSLEYLTLVMFIISFQNICLKSSIVSWLHSHIWINLVTPSRMKMDCFLWLWDGIIKRSLEKLSCITLEEVKYYRHETWITLQINGKKYCSSLTMINGQFAEYEL